MSAPQGNKNAVASKPIPGYPGHAWEITQRDEATGRATQVRFASARGGPLNRLLRKRAQGDPESTWLLRYLNRGRDVWKVVSPEAPPPWSIDGLLAALRNALDELGAAAVGGDLYANLRNATAARARITLGALADEWIAAGMPLPDGTPRSPTRCARLADFLKTALQYWRERVPASIGLRQIKDFGTWRRSQPQRPGHTGDRSTDLQLVALSTLCQWAVADERITTNPFAHRPRFRRADAVRHCHEDMPHDAAELHRICASLMADPETVTAGAYLLFQAFTGLRPGEPGGLRRDAGVIAGRYQPGHRYKARTVTPDGRAIQVPKIAIARTKRGINPAVIIHPALGVFLEAWDAYCADRWPGSPWYFPDPASPAHSFVPFGDSNSSRLSRMLNATAEAMQLPRRRPHAMRAFYVRVRVSEGIGYAQIADELGERAGAVIVKTFYAFGDDCLGDGLFDWIPADGSGVATAWRALTKGPGSTGSSDIVPFPGVGDGKASATPIATCGGSNQRDSEGQTRSPFDTESGADTVAEAVRAQGTSDASR